MKVNKYLIGVLMLLVVVFSGCSSSSESDNGTDVGSVDTTNVEVDSTQVSSSGNEESMPPSGDMDFEMQEGGNMTPPGRGEGDMPEGGMPEGAEGERPEGEGDMPMGNLDMIAEVLPESYASYESGDITEEELMEEFRTYMDSLSEEEREALMPERPARE